jgi:putative transcriptional regulator
MATRKPAKVVRKTAAVASTRRGSAAKVVRKPKKGSDILASVHATMSGFYQSGVIDAQTMRKFDRLCLEPVHPFRPAEIAALRKREKVSQPVFALYLNVSKSSVSQWETGEKKPDGPALKLLNIVERKGLAALA